MMNFSFQVVQHHESADGATGDTCWPVRPAVQKGMRLLRQRSVAGPVFQVLEGGVPAGAAETDPGRLGLGRKVRLSAASLPTPSHPGLKKNPACPCHVFQYIILFHLDVIVDHNIFLLINGVSSVKCPWHQTAARGGGSICQQSWSADTVTLSVHSTTTTPRTCISRTFLQVWGEEDQREDTESDHRKEVL